MCLKTQNKLPMVIQKKFNTNLYHAYPLCVLLSNEDYHPWFYEKYIQLWGIEWNHKWIDIGLTDSFWTGNTDGKYTEFLDITALDYDITRNLPCIRSFIQKKIDMGSYLVVFVDEFFIPTSRFHNKSHFAHEYLVYGYDFSNNTYAAVGFNAQNIFSSLQIDADCFHNAFTNAGELYKNRNDVSWLQGQSIVLIKDKGIIGEYPFSLNNFIQNLKMYYDEEISASLRYLHNWGVHDINTVTYGMACYGTIFKILSYAISDGVSVDYKVLHLLYENKVSISDRLKYVAEKYQAEQLHSIIAAYDEIVNLTNIARLKFLKISEIGAASNLSHKYVQGLGDITQALHEAQAQEKNILSAAIEALDALNPPAVSNNS